MRRPVRSEARAIASSSSCVHHCTACGPYCTSNIGLAAAAATASTSAICASTDSGGRRKRWLDFLARLRRQRLQDRLRGPIHQRIAVAHRDGKSDAHADVAGGARDLGHLGRQIGQSLDAGVMHHDGAGAAERAARQRHGGGEIGIDRRQQRQIGNPGFERLAGPAIGRGRGDAGVVVGVGQRRQRQQAPGCGLCRLDRGNAIAVDPDGVGASDRRVGGRQHMGAVQFTHRRHPAEWSRNRKIAGSAVFVNWPEPPACARLSAAGTRG